MTNTLSTQRWTQSGTKPHNYDTFNTSMWKEKLKQRVQDLRLRETAGFVGFNSQNKLVGAYCLDATYATNGELSAIQGSLSDSTKYCTMGQFSVDVMGYCTLIVAKADACAEAIVGPILPPTAVQGTKFESVTEPVCQSLPIIFVVPMTCQIPNGSLSDLSYLATFARISPEAKIWINHIDGYRKDADDVAEVFVKLDTEIKKYVSDELYEEELWPTTAPFIEIQPVPVDQQDALQDRLTKQMHLYPAASAPAPHPMASVAGASTAAAPPAALPSAATTSPPEKSLTEQHQQRIAFLEAWFASGKIDWSTGGKIVGPIGGPNTNESWARIMRLTSLEAQTSQAKSAWNSLLRPTRASMFDDDASADQEHIMFAEAVDMMVRGLVQAKLASEPVIDPTASTTKVTVWHFVAPKTAADRERRDKDKDKQEEAENDDMVGQSEFNRVNKMRRISVYGTIEDVTDVANMLTFIKSMAALCEKLVNVANISFFGQCVIRLLACAKHPELLKW